MTVAPLGPADAPALRAYLADLSDRSRRFRFFGGLFGEGAGVPPGLADQLCRADGRNRLAWAARREGVLVGECQLARTPGMARRSAEFALSVADDVQGRGVGRLLLATVADAADRWGVARLSFEVDAANGRMLAWMATLGAECVVHAGAAAGALSPRRALARLRRPAAYA